MDQNIRTPLYKPQDVCVFKSDPSKDASGFKDNDGKTCVIVSVKEPEFWRNGEPIYIVWFSNSIEIGAHESELKTRVSREVRA